MDRIEIKAMMDKKERMDMIRKFAAIRNGIEETRRIDTNGERWTYSAFISILSIFILWDCECLHNFIHKKIEKSKCRECDTNMYEQPDSRKNEIKKLIDNR